MQFYQYCTVGGDPGLGWLPQWDLSTYSSTEGVSVLQACCACGGGWQDGQEPLGVVPTMNADENKVAGSTLDASPNKAADDTVIIMVVLFTLSVVCGIGFTWYQVRKSSKMGKKQLPEWNTSEKLEWDNVDNADRDRRTQTLDSIISEQLNAETHRRRQLTFDGASNVSSEDSRNDFEYEIQGGDGKKVTVEYEPSQPNEHVKDSHQATQPAYHVASDQHKKDTKEHRSSE
jgi:hypothetical protein